MDGWSDSNVLVVQPGSLHIRVGFVSDPAPHKLLHCIARRRKQGGGIYNELTAHQGQAWSARQQQAVEASYQALRHNRDEVAGQEKKVLQQNLKNNVTLTEQVLPEDIKDRHPEYLVGEEVLEEDISEYNLHFPIKGGELNLHSGIGGSLASVLEDLTRIWEHSISTVLGIKPANFSDYRVVLLIPAVYSRSHVKHMMTVLLDGLAFQAALPLQEDVAATFGSGNAAACVVDIGHEKVSVSCVEDAISLSTSRLSLTYGGSLLTHLLHKLSQAQGFPYDADCSSLPDILLLNRIKEIVCNLDLEGVVPKEHPFSVSKIRSHDIERSASSPPGRRMSTFTFSLATHLEAVVAPLALFQLELLEYLGPHYTRTMLRDQGDPADPHSGLYLQDTSRRYIRTGDFQADDQDFDEMDQPGENQGPDAGTLPITVLDQAILRSISSIVSEDLRRRMLMNVLVVGGGAGLTGLRGYLQKKLNSQIVGGVEVLRDTREGGMDAVSWRGGAILAAMETSQELWILRDEWIKFGVKIIRERSLFSWS